MRRQKIHWGNPHHKTYPQLEEHISADFVIVGGGITGVMAAEYARAYGARSVVILEQDAIGSGSTGYSAGMLVSEIETASWKEMVAHFGASQASLYLHAQYKALKDVRNLIKKHRIECESQLDDLLMLGKGQKQRKIIELEHHAKQQMHAYSQHISESAFEGEIQLPAYRFGYRFGKGLSVNPLSCVRGIASTLAQSGRVRIFENSGVIGRTGTTVHTAHGSVSARHVIYACGAWTDSPSVGRVITTIALTEKIPKRVLKKAQMLDREMILDTGIRSYHYTKFTKRGELLLGYGDVYTESPHVDGAHGAHKRSLARYLKLLFPGARIRTVALWSQVYALSSGYVPYVRVRATHSVISGAGTQVASIVAAEHVVRTLLKRRAPLKKLFSK